MSKSDSPAGSSGGLDDLPEKMRVHALARLLGRTSREVLAALAGLGIEVRGAQSSVDRKAAEQVVVALVPDAVSDPAVPDAVVPDAVVPDVVAPAQAEPVEHAPAAPMAPLFAAPAPLFQEPTRPARTRRRAAVEPAEATDEVPAAQDRRGDADPVADAASDEATDDTAPAAGDVDDSDDEDSAARRRRRRGRRGRGRGRGADGMDDDNDENDTDGNEAGAGDSEAPAAPADSGSDERSSSEDEDDDDASDGDSVGSRRRRRRRRRKGSGDDSTDAGDEQDPPNTVTRVRQPREPRSDDSGDGDGVQSVRGSTRLEAKRQRRRDGRDAGRRRVPILSEAEFLARRESVDRSMVVRERGDRIEIGVLEDDILVEHFVAGRDGGSMVGNIYLGRVQNVLPSMEAAFVDIGRGRNAVLYAGEVDWDAAGLGGKARRIEQALSSGDPVLVQVTKDPIGHKGARLTTQISLAGRFLVYVPSGGAAGISRKLPDVERKRLKDMLKEIVPSEAGVIIRTASEGVSHEALERDVRRLQAQWEVVKGKAEQTGPNKPKAPVLLYEEPDLLLKVVRDQFNEDFSRLVVEGDDAWDTLQNYVGHVAPELGGRLHRHVGTQDVFAEFRIDEQLLKALDRKVWLPSGGTLVIDRTEAMTVIDVNTGKFTGSGGNLEETVTRNNLEAAEEVVRQLRLRDIGGIIVVDFIDMVLEANRDLVLRRLTECLSRDRTRHQVAEVTSLGLVQMTRKRVGGGLLEHFSAPCEHCRGRGVVIDTEPVVEKSDAGRQDRSEREGADRRSRRGGRRGDGEQNGAQQNGVQQNGRNGSSADADDALIEVEATAPVAEVPVAEVTDALVAEAPAEEAPAVEEPVAEVPVADAPVARRRRRAVRAGTAAVPEAVEPAVTEPAVTELPVTDSPVTESPVTEPAVTEPAVTEPAAATESVQPEPVQPESVQPEPVQPESVQPESVQPEPAPSEPAQPDDGTRNGAARAPRQRRGRVTRTAGAPAAADGDTPVVAVVTVPAAATTEQAAPAAVAPQPEPTVVTRPRRSRRAASRPAGPPVAEVAGESPIESGGDTGGDPV